MFSKKYFFYGIFFGITLLLALILQFPDGKLHLIFCNVGQGDAIYIKTPVNLDMLIDGGPDKKVLSCLGENMPFYDRTIDLVVLSHPEKDHFGGLIEVLERYKVNHFILNAVGNQVQNYQKLLELIQRKKIPVKILYTGESFSLGEVHFKVFWPEKKWVASKIESLKEASSLVWTFSEGEKNQETRKVLGLADVNFNYFSYYLHLAYGRFDVLFTGDGDSKVQPEILKKVDLPEIEVLKFPHHGSKYGVLPEFLEMVKPQLAIISVGRNPWGHPTKETIELLDKKGIEIKRTDMEGNIKIVSDGEKWWKEK